MSSKADLQQTIEYSREQMNKWKRAHDKAVREQKKLILEQQKQTKLRAHEIVYTALSLNNYLLNRHLTDDKIIELGPEAVHNVLFAAPAAPEEPKQQ